MSFIKNKKKVGFVLLLLIGAGMLLIPVQSGFSLTDEDEKQLYFFPSKTKQVVIGWRHSVELTPWEETYHVLASGDLTLHSTKYKSYGAGTPEAEGVTKLLSDGYIFVTDIERTIPYYSLFYIPVSQYYIKVSGRKYLLSNLASDFQNIQVHFKSIQGYEWLYLMLAKERIDYE